MFDSLLRLFGFREVEHINPEMRVGAMAIKRTDIKGNSYDVFDTVIEVTDTHVVLQDLFCGFKNRVCKDRYKAEYVTL
jgi:hypothetical protein